MFDTFNGLPVHPLVVHAVVVLLPLAVLGTLAIAVRPRWRTSYGPLVVGAALVATVLTPVATSSGESLEEKVGDPGEHAELGDQLLWFALALLIAAGALVWLQWRAERAERAQQAQSQQSEQTGRVGVAGTPGPAPAAHAADGSERAGRVGTDAEQTRLMVVAVVAVIAALACAVQVYRVGDSGARAAWGDVGAAPTGAPVAGS
ncbi:DUF2231 domain-containing protein [Nocardioides rubriscoriae]|uniref:DUF2231 domain-containing protein n=1 Tax=Nocardioides rubriscoriae TaxID=642762 RepID=UPI0011E06D86|nr:DUF2231 domain-containing protein [Nocardioides rubriscoriae]